MADLGRWFIFVGIFLVVIGTAAVWLGRSHIPLGRLPGDILLRGKRTTLYFPLTTSILLSLALSILLYVFGRFRR